MKNEMQNAVFGFYENQKLKRKCALCEYQPPPAPHFCLASTTFKSVHTSYHARHHDFTGSTDNDDVYTFKITSGNDGRQVDQKYQRQ